MTTRVQQSPPRSPAVHPWTKDDYHALGEAGFLHDGRVELLNGMVIDMPPIGTWHATGVGKATSVFTPHAVGFHVRVQQPLDLGADSEPVPDVTLVRGTLDDYLEAHPTTALLVIEVAERSLAYDQGEKLSAYAKAGIADYWIVNLVERQLEVYRDAVESSELDAGWGYATKIVRRQAEVVRPLLVPGIEVRASDLVP